MEKRTCPRCAALMVKLPYSFVVSWWQCGQCEYAEVVPLGYCERVEINIGFTGEEGSA